MFDPKSLIESGGLLIVTIMVFAESGMLVGFFLPGDTLLFSAGFLASTGKISLVWLIVCVIFAAIAGCNTGYEIGKRGGRKLFNKPDGLFFRQDYIKKAEDFYDKNGGKTISLAQFVPIARTFVPVVAGVAGMDRKKFVMYNILGVFLWGTGVVLLGFFLGQRIPNIDKYLLPIIGLAVLVSFGPMVYHIIKALIEDYKKKQNKIHKKEK